MRARQGNGAFTLTELLVVVAVILILLSLVILGADTAYTQAMQVKCQHRLEQIWNACLMHAAGNQATLPAAWSHELAKPWYDVLVDEGYVDTGDTIRCRTPET